MLFEFHYIFKDSYSLKDWHSIGRPSSTFCFARPYSMNDISFGYI